MKNHVPIADLTFDQLPQAVTRLQEKLDKIEKLLLEKNHKDKPDPDELLTVPQAAEFLRLSIPTVYGLISKRDLPVMKRSKRCYFSKLELMEYLKAGRKKTTSEIEAEPGEYLRKKRG